MARTHAMVQWWWRLVVVAGRRQTRAAPSTGAFCIYFSGKRSRRSQAVLCCSTRVEPGVALPRLRPRTASQPPIPAVPCCRTPSLPLGGVFLWEQEKARTGNEVKALHALTPRIFSALILHPLSCEALRTYLSFAPKPFLPLNHFPPIVTSELASS